MNTFEEVEITEEILTACPDGQSVKLWKTIFSAKDEASSHYIYGIKSVKAPWSKAQFLCTCERSAFALPLLVWGHKVICKHATLLRETL